jgi:phosphopantetheine adenylyltransferase
MESYVKDALSEWKEEMLKQKIEIDEEYEKVKCDLQLYSYKFGITKQVIQSTINDEIINNIKTSYQKPFEEKYTELKHYIKELEEKRRVYQMFVEKIEKVSEIDETSLSYD